MDWHLVEVGVVTTLSIWVYLFSPSPVSRFAAAAMFVINLVWIIFERENLSRSGKPAPHPPAGTRAMSAPAESQGDTGDGLEAQNAPKDQMARTAAEKVVTPRSSRII